MGERSLALKASPEVTVYSAEKIMISLCAMLAELQTHCGKCFKGLRVQVSGCTACHQQTIRVLSPKLEHTTAEEQIRGTSGTHAITAGRGQSRFPTTSCFPSTSHAMGGNAVQYMEASPTTGLNNSRGTPSELHS